MADISLESVSGDLAVSRNVAAGGGLTVSGKTELGGRVVVKDWLDAPNIVGPCKGLYADEEALVEAFPRPMSGWWAMTDPVASGASDTPDTPDTPDTSDTSGASDTSGTSDAGKVTCSVFRAWKGKWIKVGGMSLEVSVPDVTTSDKIDEIDGSVTALEAGLENEVSDRKEQCESLESSISEEAASREAADAELRNDITDLEHLLEEKQDALKYYKESGGAATLEIGGVDVEASSGGLEVSAKDCEFTYNGSEVATRRDIAGVEEDVEAGLANLEAELSSRISGEAASREAADAELRNDLTDIEHELAGKQDALKYYKESGGLATLEIGGVDVEASSGGLEVSAEDCEFTYNGSKVATRRDIAGVEEDVEAGLAKKQDKLKYYEEVGDNWGTINFDGGNYSALVGAGLYGVELICRRNSDAYDIHEVMVDNRGAFYDGAEIATVDDIEALSDAEIDEILEGLELVDVGSVVTSVSAGAEGLMELGAEREGGAVTLSGRTTIGSVGREEVEDMFNKAEI